MLRCMTSNGERIVSRIRDGYVELVDWAGKVERLTLDEFSRLPKPYMVERGVVPRAVPFRERPREFLTALRTRRDIDLARRPKRTDKGPRVKGPAKPKSLKKSTDDAIGAAMAQMDPSIAAALAAQLAGLKAPKKGSK